MVVPVDLGAQHIVFLFEERVGRFDVVEVIDGLHGQHYRPPLNLFSLSLKFFKTGAAASDAVLRGMFIQLCDQEQPAYCHDYEVDCKSEQGTAALALKEVTQKATINVKIDCLQIGEVNEHAESPKMIIFGVSS